MSNTNSYLPIPERAWSRVENRCPNPNDLSSNTALINKGNVLQYKKNSSQLTSIVSYV